MAKRWKQSGLVLLPISLVVLLLDQASKFFVYTFLATGTVYPVTDFFNLVMLYNPGAAFSFLSEAGGWQRWLFTGIAVVISLIIVVWLRRLSLRQNILLALALSLVLGGAIGNMTDRLLLGAVVDFLDFHWRGVHWPAFNVADMAISIGAFLLLLDALVAYKREPKR